MTDQAEHEEEILEIEEEELEEEQEEEEAEEEEGAEDEAEEESEEEAEEEGEEETPTPKKAGRADKRIQTLTQREKAAKEEAAAAKAQAAALQAQLQIFTQHGQSLSQAEAKRQEEERVSKMQPHERVAYEANKQNQMLQQQMMGLQFQIVDTADKSSYEAKMVTNPTLKRIAPQVEQMRQDFLAKGQTVPRENLAAYIIGQEVLKKQLAGESPRKKAAAKRVDAATSRSTTARGDVTRTRKGKTAEQRLEGVSI